MREQYAQPEGKTQFSSRKHARTMIRQGLHMGEHVPWEALNLGRNILDGSGVRVDPLPHEYIRLLNGRLWLWLPQETSTRLLHNIMRNAPFAQTEYGWERFGIRISNLWQWRPGGILSPCAYMWERNLKWRWSLARDGLNPRYDPRTFTMKDLRVKMDEVQIERMWV